jgi:hypothetical protein
MKINAGIPLGAFPLLGYRPIGKLTTENLGPPSPINWHNSDSNQPSSQTDQTFHSIFPKNRNHF